jgi:hypothetical protein
VSDWIFPVLFAAFWTAICLGIARAGWSSLAASYRSREAFDGETRHFRSAQIGSSAYRSCLTMGARPWGLYLSVLFPFRPGHPPLLIPWQDISATETKRGFGSGYEMRFRRVPGVAMQVSKDLGDALQTEAGSMWKEVPEPWTAPNERRPSGR